MNGAPQRNNFMNRDEMSLPIIYGHDAALTGLRRQLFAMHSFFRPIALAASLLLLAGSARATDLLVLMHGPGKVERYDMASGAHVGTLLSGLPPSNVLLFDAEGRLLISTGLPGGAGHVLRYDMRGKVETWLDVPELK